MFRRRDSPHLVINVLGIVPEVRQRLPDNISHTQMPRKSDQEGGKMSPVAEWKIQQWVLMQRSLMEDSLLSDKTIKLGFKQEVWQIGAEIDGSERPGPPLICLGTLNMLRKLKLSFSRLTDGFSLGSEVLAVEEVPRESFAA